MITRLIIIAAAFVSCLAAQGVLGFTKSAAFESAAQGIRINAVCPGLIQTAMAEQMIAAGQGEALKAMEKSIPMGRMGPSEEIANAVLWLSRDAAGQYDANQSRNQQQDKSKQYHQLKKTGGVHYCSDRLW